MPIGSVRLALRTAAALFAMSTVLAAQQPRRVRITFALGTTVPTGYVVDVPTDIGAHVQLGAAWYRSPRFAFRADMLAQMLSGAAAEPSCIPGGVCRGFAFHPDQVYSGTVSAEFRPFASARRVFGLAGGGLYYARGPEATDFGTTFGALGGVGLDLAPVGRAGFALEARYHYLASAFGTLTGMFTPSVVFRF